MNTQGQVSTKPGAAVDPNAGIWFAASRSLRQAGRTLSVMADRAMKRQQATDLKSAQQSGERAGYSADLGTGVGSGNSEIGQRLMGDLQKDFDLSPEQAAGFVGNLAHESGGFQTLQEVDPTVAGSRGGFGYAQWTGDRRKQFEDFAKRNNLDPSSYEANYGFLKFELTNTKEGQFLDQLRKAGDARSATEIVSNSFLRPGIPNMESRYKWAERFAGANGGQVAQHRANTKKLSSGGLPDSTGQIVGRTDEGRPIVRNVDGSVSTERTITVTDKRINGGKPTNIPTMYGGKIVDDETASDIIAKNKGIDPDTGRKLSSYNSISEAEAAAAARSKQLGKQIDKVRPGTGRPSSSGPALALRRGDTPMGEAYAAAQNRAISRRLPIEVSQQLDALYEENKDDPAALTQAFDEAENTVLGKIGHLTGNDPEAILFVQQTFAKKRFGYEKSARAAEDARVRDGELSDYNQTIGDAVNGLQKQAYLAANDEEAGESLSVSINENLASVESALDAGVISPQAAKRDRAAILGAVTFGRIDGAFDALPDAESKTAFVEELKDRWANGDEFLKDLSLEKIQYLEGKYTSAISREKKATTAAAKLSRQKMQSMVNDDVASKRKTGVGLSIDGQELSFDQVKSTLGEEFATKWQHDRQIASGIYNATASLDVMSASEMQSHLQALQPKAGASGFTDQATIHDTAQKEAQRILKQRKEDPALAVDNAFDELQPIREQAYEGDPVAMEELIKGRLDAQEAIGISDYAKAPLTNSELASVAMPVAGEVDRQTWNEMFAQLNETYGPYADEVMAQILHWKGLHKDVAAAVTQYMEHAALGQKPSRIQGNAQVQKIDAVTSEQAMKGGFGAVQWKAIPNYEQINLLLSNPDLSGRFDDKFGAGASVFYSNAQEQSRHQTELYRQNMERQGISINEDGSENYDPTKDKAQ
nr:phage tail tip lysozyme [uncultured Cohaesibacter sp.]